METDLQDAPQRVDAEVGAPLSQRIRQRIRRDGVRFHANDNIADYLREARLKACRRKWPSGFNTCCVRW
jgi:GTP cyclohydrolase I